MVQRKVYFDKKRKKYYIKKFRNVKGKRKLVKVFLTAKQLKALRLKRVRRFRKSSTKLSLGAEKVRNLFKKSKELSNIDAIRKMNEQQKKDIFELLAKRLGVKTQTQTQLNKVPINDIIGVVRNIVPQQALPLRAETDRSIRELRALRNEANENLSLAKREALREIDEIIDEYQSALNLSPLGPIPDDVRSRLRDGSSRIRGLRNTISSSNSARGIQNTITEILRIYRADKDDLDIINRGGAPSAGPAVSFPASPAQAVRGPAPAPIPAEEPTAEELRKQLRKPRRSRAMAPTDEASDLEKNTAKTRIDGIISSVDSAIKSGDIPPDRIDSVKEELKKLKNIRRSINATKRKSLIDAKINEANTIFQVLASPTPQGPPTSPPESLNKEDAKKQIDDIVDRLNIAGGMPIDIQPIENLKEAIDRASTSEQIKGILDDARRIAFEIEQRGEGNPVALTNEQIDKIMRAEMDKLPKSNRGVAYLGAYPRDVWFPIVMEFIKKYKKQLDGSKNKRLGIVINTDPLGEKGQHWVGLYCDFTGSKSCEFYDPYGLPWEFVMKEPVSSLKQRLVKIIEALDIDDEMKFKTNYVQDQSKKVNNKTCGYHVINFLISRMKGEPFRKLTKYDEFLTQEGTSVGKGEKRAFKLHKKYEKKFDLI